ncbi:MAG TPA: TIGR03013 family XrtA/PEP-CTERM system glycosyltransferase [Acidobacteriaceae bacterium]|jgi:sugar transferase (PEP-CTERM system associated)|nr:TIGR03013 family XrtA/PEP-CTERM system glycosyltransferase [Acidobacteriaceae bacterium]
MIRFFNVYYPTRTIILILCEALIVYGSFVLASVLLLGPSTMDVLADRHGVVKIGALTVLTILCAYYFDLYEPQQLSAPWEIYFRLLLVIGCLSLLLSLVVFVFPQVDIARYVFLLGLGLVVILLTVWRHAFEWISGKSMFRERVFVLGTGVIAANLVESIRNRKEAGMEVIGSDSPLLHPIAGHGASAATIDQVALMKPPVDRVVIALEERRGELPVDALLAMRMRGVEIEEVGSLLERLTGKMQLEGLRPSNLLFCEGFNMKRSLQVTQRVASTIAALTILLLFLPFFPFVVLAVKLSSKGPVFFSQTRVGLEGHVFNVHKFRTMFTDAEAKGARWATKDDPRVTRVGAFLRKTRIDEVPQLWNVLLGEMSFVGPRPERPEFISWLAEEIPFYNLRHMVRPGLTGWAQVRYGYGATLAESREKLSFDLYYLKHKSLGLDLLIMFETIKTIVRRRGAQ